MVKYGKRVSDLANDSDPPEGEDLISFVDVSLKRSEHSSLSTFFRSPALIDVIREFALTSGGSSDPDTPTSFERFVRDEADGAPQASPGDEWFAPDTGNTYLRYDSGTSIVWLHVASTTSVAAAGGSATVDTDSVRNAGGVMTTGDQSIAGIKTFTASPLVPAPVTEFQVVNKGHLDQTAVLNSQVNQNIKTLTLPANTTISQFILSLLNDQSATEARSTLGVPAATTVVDTVKLTAAEYAALTPDPDTIYYVVG